MRGAEARPRVHVTADGWLNDPVGGLAYDGRQHLLFQHVPGSTQWDVGCHWGHLAGEDLVRLRHLPVALSPGEGDDGVWSGSAVADGTGPVLVYTGVEADRQELGRVSLARPLDDALLRWRKEGPVLGPPPGLDVVAFRDPYVWGSPGDWHLLAGASLADRGAAVLRYAGTDLETWRLVGVHAEAGPSAGLGDMWECPQHVDLAGRPALIVSVSTAGRLDRVVATLGAGTAGAAGGPWETLGYGGSAYALAAYRDLAGRPAATAWLRDGDTAERIGWSGMLSLPLLLSAAGERVHVAPHPDVDTLRRDPLDVRTAGGEVLADLDDGLADLAAVLPPAGRLRLETADRPVELTAGGAGLSVTAAGRTTTVPAGAGAAGHTLRVVVDRGVVEAWTGDGRWVALRVPHLYARRAALTGGGRLAAWRLEPVQA